MTSKVRIGIAGCGVIGQKHAAAAAACEQIELVAVADLNAEAANKVAQQHGVGTVHGSAEALIDDPCVDAVVLALTANLRTPLALRAFRRGKHVLTEKPVAMHADEVRQMIEARGDRIGACCSSRHRFLPSADAATQIVASGKLGALRVVRARAVFAAPPPPPPDRPPPVWRLRSDLNAGGIMSNWGCYDLDYLLGITGWRLRPRSVLANVWSVASVFADRTAPGSNAETHVAALIRCDEGIVLALERGEFTATTTETAWQIIGEHGALRLDLLPRSANRLMLDEAEPARGVVSSVAYEGDETWDMVHQGPVQDFAAAILEQRQPRTSLEHALVIQQITDAIYASASSGEAVTIR